MNDCDHRWIPCSMNGKPAKMCVKCRGGVNVSLATFRKTFGFTFRQVMRAQKLEEEKDALRLREANSKTAS